jgi:hypothetical protein
MTTALDLWLAQATRRLARDAAATVRSEIEEHFDASQDAALAAGATGADAERVAITALGDAKTANRQYRAVMLTRAEARVLSDAKWEARVVCSRPWVRWALAALPVAALAGAAVFTQRHELTVARILLVAGVGTALAFVGPFLPVYTAARGRVYRGVKWAAIIGVVTFAFGPDALKWSWLLASCLWPFIWIEWTRLSIRRKLPMSEWPKALYL